jgi:hypothetical protein
MEKQQLVAHLKGIKKQLTWIVKRCDVLKDKQVRNKDLLEMMEALAVSWFEEIEQSLEVASPDEEEKRSKYRDLFGKLLEISGASPAKGTVITLCSTILQSFHSDLIVPVQKRNIEQSKYPSLDKCLNHSQPSEQEYLQEAIDCARIGKNRAAIILGWCAAVDRLHNVIVRNGFNKFNEASQRMAAIQTGRYKRFNKKFDIQNLADLRMTVFDSDLLWILEFIGIVDGNQHDRLEICFTMRNTSAHPGEARVSPENVLSFFSDIDTLVFGNEKCKLTSGNS